MSGRGRGRGRGGVVGPQVRDDDGNVVVGDEGPPPLFPEITVPEGLGSDDRLDRLQGEYQKLVAYWKHSPFNLDNLNKADAGLPASRVERWSDRHSGKPSELSLSAFMTLDPEYFPQELYSEKDKRESKQAASTYLQQRAVWERHRNAGRSNEEEEKRMAALLEMEKRQAAAAGKEGGTPAKKPEEEEAEENEAEIEDEEDNDEDDDYNQGQAYDDDEGYVDEYADDDNGDACF